MILDNIQKEMVSFSSDLLSKHGNDEDSSTINNDILNCIPSFLTSQEMHDLMNPFTWEELRKVAFSFALEKSRWVFSDVLS